MMFGNYGSMMGNWGWFGFWAQILWIVVLVDLILLGVWLWKKIQEKR